MDKAAVKKSDDVEQTVKKAARKVIREGAYTREECAAAIQEVCNKMGYTLKPEASLIPRDDGTYSIVANITMTNLNEQRNGFIKGNGIA
jgi:hypothetical protein